MKNIGRIFIVISIVLFICSLSGLVSALSPEKLSESGIKGEEKPYIESSPTQAYQYVIRNENGHIFLYRSSRSEPECELDISYCDLPPEDRAMLDNGIAITDEQHLLKVIEDYSG